MAEAVFDGWRGFFKSPLLIFYVEFFIVGTLKSGEGVSSAYVPLEAFEADHLWLETGCWSPAAQAKSE